MTPIFSRTLGLLALGGTLVACGETRVPPAFEDDRTAWLAGCRSGHAQGEARYGKGSTRDAERYADDPAYRAAWDAGYEACIREARRIGGPGGGGDGAARRGGGLPAAKSGPGDRGGGTPAAKSPSRGGGGGGGGMAAGH